MNYHKKILSNGLRIISVPLKASKAVTVMVLVGAGSDYETKDINGLSHFLEHMCFQGTVKRPNTGDISRELDSLGAQSNAFTSKEFTGYWAKAEKKHFPKLVEIVSDIYQNSTFNIDAMEREKGVVIEEMRMYEDMPHTKAPEAFEALLYGDQPAGRSIIGTEENVRALTQEKLVAYRKKHYVAKNTLVVVSGGVNPAQVEKLVKEAFMPISKSKKENKLRTKESQKTPQIKVVYKETDQAHIVVGVRSYNVSDKDNHKITLLETILGKGMSSRLFRKLRDDLGLCYYVRADNDTALDRGYFGVASGVAKDKVKDALKAILVEMKRLTEELVSEEELKKAKEFRIGNMYLSLETSDAFADFYSSQELYGLKIKSPEEKAKKLQTVTAKEIREVARKLFVDRNLNLSIVGPYKNEDEFKELLTFSV